MPRLEVACSDPLRLVVAIVLEFVQVEQEVAVVLSLRLLRSWYAVVGCPSCLCAD